MLKEAIISTFVVTNLLLNSGVAQGAIDRPYIDPAPSAPAGEEERGWVAQPGDRLEVNVAKNIGYLIHPNGTKYEFEVLTGQQHMVYYLGMYYFGGTPLREWEIKSKDIKEDRVTFGQTGEFLRMYRDGESSPYGIHSHKYFESMMDSDNHYRSYGCILTSDEVLDLIEASYLANGEYLRVTTYWEE